MYGQPHCTDISLSEEEDRMAMVPRSDFVESNKRILELQRELENVSAHADQVCCPLCSHLVLCLLSDGLCSLLGSSFLTSCRIPLFFFVFCGLHVQEFVSLCLIRSRDLWSLHVIVRWC